MFILSNQIRKKQILFITLASILGFSPMLFETGVQAKFLIPVKLSIEARLYFGVIVILTLVSTRYMVIADMQYISPRSHA